MASHFVMDFVIRPSASGKSWYETSLAFAKIFKFCSDGPSGPQKQQICSDQPIWPQKKTPYFTYFTNSSTVLILEKITLHPSRQHRPTLIFLAIDLTTFNTGYFSNTNRFFLIPFLVKIFRNENELWNTPSHKYLSEKDIKICTK